MSASNKLDGRDNGPIYAREGPILRIRIIPVKSTVAIVAKAFLCGTRELLDPQSPPTSTATYLSLENGSRPYFTWSIMKREKSKPSFPTQDSLDESKVRSVAKGGHVWVRDIQAEVLEPRLVLSAQPLFDLSHHAMVDHQPFDFLADANLPSQSAPDAPMGPVNPFGPAASSPSDLAPQVSEAHSLTGWNAVQQQFGLHGDDQTVAVIDSGIAWDHVALGKGYGAGYRVVGGWDFAENDSNPYDDAPAGFHGTHVAGIIAADGKEQGVAPKADLVALRVFADNGATQLAWTEQALQWVHQNRNAFEHPITTVNLSLGSSWNGESIPEWASLEDDLKQLYDDGIVIVAAAGNSFQQYKTAGLTYPAASSYVIPVSSVDNNGNLSDFSQRSDRSIAAPGQGILSTVPDHVLGRDGKIDDWSAATGTSMAAPYVAGASVLVREAMEMAGWDNIDSQSIFKVITDTADSTWDAITSHNYHRLNLERAIDSILPDDQVGDSLASAHQVSIIDGATTNGWLNTLGDHDVYRFQAQQDGTLQLHLNSPWLNDVHWSTWDGTTEGAGQGGNTLTMHVHAGQSYGFGLSDADSIGSFKIDWDFTASPTQGGSNDNPSPTPIPTPVPVPTPLPSGGGHSTDMGSITKLGVVDATSIRAGSLHYQMQAAHDGLLTLQLSLDASPSAGNVNDANNLASSLEAKVDQSSWLSDSTWEDGHLRLDLNVSAGQTVDVDLSSFKNLHGKLEIANLVQRSGSSLVVHDTTGSDQFKLDLHQGTRLTAGGIDYLFGSNEIQSIALSAGMGNDSLDVTGSSNAETVELRPGQLSLENIGIHVTGTGIEAVRFVGGGGPDRVYMYDADTDDVLSAHPDLVELSGVGYKFVAEQVARVYVNATAGGDDIAYLYDSAEDDILTVRPQFSSIRSEKYFNYASGFEQVFAYASAGGHDTAQLYDSAGDDRFNTTGDAASIVGSGFFSYTRYFESIEAYSIAGGHDTASLYATHQASLTIGIDFASFEEDGQSRLARGFEHAQTFVNGEQIKLSPGTIAYTTDSLPSVASNQPMLPSAGMDTSLVGSAIPATDSDETSPHAVLKETTVDATIAESLEATLADASRALRMPSIGESVPTEMGPSLGPWMSMDDGAIDENATLEMSLMANLLEAHRMNRSNAANNDLDLLLDPSLESRMLDAIFARHG